MPPVATRPLVETTELLRERAAVLAWFSGAELDLPAADAGDEFATTEFLMTDCQRVPGPDGTSRWALKDQVRHRTLLSMGAERARALLAAQPTVPDDPVQDALARALGLGQPQPADTRESVAAELHVARWLDGLDVDLPEIGELDGRLKRFELTAPFEAFLADGFYGREDWLALLADHLHDDDGQPLVISGVGGVGKSTLIAKFVTDTVTRETGVHFAYLNFDRGALAANRPTTLLAEIITQVAIQVPRLAGAATALVRELTSFDSVQAQAMGASTRQAMSTGDDGPASPLVRVAADLLNDARADRVLVLLDTFEEVQRQRITNLFVLWDFLRRLRDLVPALRVIVSGRALDGDPDALVGLEVRELSELDEEAAIRMVMEADGLDASEELARRTIELVSRNPLSVRLAIDILRRSDHADPLLDLELQEGQIQGQLYQRILMHIEDPVVRKLAHPGLVVRVITPDVIRHVLARPCEIDVPDDESAQRLFAALEAEATLVNDDGGLLRHRGDVRALMLPALRRDQRLRVDRIHRSAVKYYRSLATADARAEELYHRLMLGQTERTLDKYWDDTALASLLASLDELPDQGKVYLWSKSDGEISLSAEITTAASNEAWARATEPTAAAEIRAGRPERALDLLTERRGPDGESLLPAIEVEVLEELGRLDEALTLLDAARQSALRHKRPALAVELTMHRMRVLERQGRFDDALAEALELAESLTGRRGESALDYLAATASYLRLLRRTGRQGDPDYDRVADEVAVLADQLPYRELASRPGLLRELLAEIGGRSERLLRFGIETVGVARGTSDRLDEQLDRIEESEAPDASDLEATTVAPTADVSPDPAPPVDLDDDELETRSSLGKKVASHTADAGLDEDLSNAVAESYQTETDGLYS